MSIKFREPDPPRPPSLAHRAGLDGNIEFLNRVINGHKFWIAAENNGPQMINVVVC